MVLLVLIDGETWIADAGLGEGFLDPLPLREGTYPIGPFTWTLERETAGTWWLAHHEWGSFSGFRMASEASPVIDFEPHHRRLATDPGVLVRADAGRPEAAGGPDHTLRARTLSAVGPAVDTKHVVADVDEFESTLAGLDFVVSGERLTRLWDAACAQHEAFLAKQAVSNG